MNVEEKVLRVKHMRLLEKFLKSSTTVLKLENFNYELFEKRANKIYDLIKNLEEIRLDSTRLKALKNFSELTIRTLNNENLKVGEKRFLLLKEANLIEKQKNKISYKKSKHKKIEHEI